MEVHAKRLGAGLITEGKKEVRTFSTLTEDLLRLLDWLTQAGGSPGASESTGGYGRARL
jgi:hypothetical protein